MKKFDYLCLLYSILLLIFGFSDDVPGKKERVSKPGDARSPYIFVERRVSDVVVAEKSTAVKALERQPEKKAYIAIR